MGVGVGVGVWGLEMVSMDRVDSAKLRGISAEFHIYSAKLGLIPRTLTFIPPNSDLFRKTPFLNYPRML
ncbi:hypothetical protein SAMN05444673_5268 [Bacillus sp. OV166]|nr:hypothetical protein SAMN05444673_5268 [Bacillus sp. OV166]